MLITFEGIDGCGKSTQVQRLARHLSDRNIEVVTCRDPGSTAAGDAVRDILLHREQIPLAMKTEMFLYMAARAQLVNEIIQPALDARRTVLCDRFLLSNVVYQGWAGGLTPELVVEVGRIATGGLRPALTLLFDVPLDVAAARRGDIADRLEKRGEDFFRRLREGYQHLADGSADRVIRIDADQSVDRVSQNVLAAVEPLFPAS